MGIVLLHIYSHSLKNNSSYYSRTNWICNVPVYTSLNEQRNSKQSSTEKQFPLRCRKKPSLHSHRSSHCNGHSEPLRSFRLIIQFILWSSNSIKISWQVGSWQELPHCLNVSFALQWLLIQDCRLIHLPLSSLNDFSELNKNRSTKKKENKSYR